MMKQIVSIRNYVIAPKIYLKEICVNVWIGSAGVITGMIGTAFRTRWWKLGRRKVRKGGREGVLWPSV
jgi:hypothetical protein